MIELIVYNYLNGKLSVPVKMERPENEPEEYVLIEKTGSSSENFIFSAVIAVQSYAMSMARAVELNEEVKNAMAQIIVLKDISGVRLNTDYNYTDKTKKKHRYQAVFEIFY